jgi:hypothetical protein
MRYDELADELTRTREKDLSILEKVFLCMISVLYFVWPSNSLTNRLPRGWRLYYMAGSAILLSLILARSFWFPAYFISVFVTFRIADILLHRVHRVLFLEERSSERAILTLLVHVYELVVSYAILYLSCRCILGPTHSVMATATDAMYFSTVTMATEGYGDFLPTDAGRWLVTSQLAVEVIFVVAVVPEVVRLFSSGSRTSASPTSLV